MLKNNIKKYRVAKNLSQGQLAEQLFVSRQTVSKWEQGTNEPDVDTLKKLCEILGVSIETLVYGTENEHEENVTQKSSKSVTVSGVLFTVNTLLFVFCSVSVFILLGLLPDTIPAHYNAYGEIDRYGSKAEILLNLLSFILFYSTDLICRLFLKKKGDKLQTAAAVVSGVTAAIQVAYETFILCLYAPYFTKSQSTCITVFCADLILAVSIGMLPFFSRPNAVIGVRTDFTLSDKTAWNKVNTFASAAFAVTSAALIIAGVFIKSEYSFLILIAYLLPTIAVTVYHEILRKKQNNK